MPHRPSKRFDDTVTRFLADYYANRPVEASEQGMTTYDSRTLDTTAAGYAARDRADAKWLASFQAFDAATLSDSQRIDLSLLVSQLRKSTEISDYASWRRDPTEYLTDGCFELFQHENRDEKEAAEAAISRLRAVPSTIANGMKNLDPALATRVLIEERGIPSARAQAEFVRDDLPGFVKDPVLRARVAAAGADAARAYEEFADFLGGFAKKAHGNFAFGEKRYNAVLRDGEGLSFDARTLRDMGRAQFDAINTEMEDLAEQISGSRDWHALVGKLQDTHPSSMKDLLAAYRKETERAREFVRDHDLMTLPAGERCAVEPAPKFMRSMVSVASYFPPPVYGKKAQGTFNVPFTPDGATPAEQEQRLRSNADYLIPSVTAHEAYPGHHLHFVESENTNKLRQALTSTYFIEGWGLYVEQMMGEQGFYSSKEAKLGQLNMRLFRAARIIVDTSLHLGEMSFDDAVAFMRDKCGFPEATARGEVRRYCSWPTQASAYLTGAIEIDRLAKEWLSDKKGTLKEFHDAITSSGKLPLGVAASALGLANSPAPAVPAHSL